MASLTIKQLDERVLRKLRDLAGSRRVSMNTFLRQLLARAVGLEPGLRSYDDLKDVAGTWSAEDEREFLDATQAFRRIDESMWH